MTIFVIALLIILSGVFVMSEMAIVSARKARLKQLSEGGRTGAGRALALANKPANFLSTVQFGITVISILSGAMGEDTLSAGRLPKTCPRSRGCSPTPTGWRSGSR